MINKITITELKRISADNGDVLHGLKKSDYGYNGFGEVYFSITLKNKIKAWKMHNEMTLNLVVPNGAVRFNFIEVDGSDMVKNRLELTVSSENYCRITVPPGIIFGFKGLRDEVNIVANIGDIEHRDGEVRKIEMNKFDFK